MKREALIRELRKRAKRDGTEFEVDQSHGKGSHYVIRFGDRSTTLKSGELSPGYVKLIMRQLGID